MQPQKAKLPTYVSPSDRVTLWTSLSLNASSDMPSPPVTVTRFIVLGRHSATDACICASVRAEPSKIDELKDSIALEIVTLSRAWQSEKAADPKYDTLCGMVTEIRAVSQKAYLPILFTDCGIVTEVKNLTPLNALSPIATTDNPL